VKKIVRNVTYYPGDVVLSLYHGGGRVGRMMGTLIRWRPFRWGKSRYTGYSHAMGLDTNHYLVSAEGGKVRRIAFADYLNKHYSIIVCRPPVFNIRESVDLAVRMGIGRELDALAGTKYSKRGIVGHALDTILSLGGKVFESRPFANILARDKALYCSETVAVAFKENHGYRFLKYGTLNKRLKTHMVRPRDIEWTMAVERWEIIQKTRRGVAVDRRFDIYQSGLGEGMLHLSLDEYGELME
jgi:hypothetical protein